MVENGMNVDNRFVGLNANTCQRPTIDKICFRIGFEVGEMLKPNVLKCLAKRKIQEAQLRLEPCPFQSPPILHFFHHHKLLGEQLPNRGSSPGQGASQ